jgi:hypothetical protein
MSTLTLKGLTSGSSVLKAPDSGSNEVTFTMPASTGTLLTTDGSAANLTSIPAANITGTLPAISATNLTAIPAANITGTLPAISGANLTNLPSKGKNLIINGAMNIDQRSSGASTTVTGNSYVTCDRWITWASASSKYSVSQSSTAPIGFNNSLLFTSLSAYTPLASDYFYLSQQIEGFNFAHAQWGTTNAKTITISFWVRSSLTGTFGGGLENSGGNRSYPFTYTISSADTWEQKTITVAGDTTGTWIGATNGNGVTLWFGIGTGSDRQGTPNSWQAGNYPMPTGSTNVVATNAATLHITGIKLEVGTAATDFEHRSYGEELALCQRYCYKTATGVGNSMYGIGFVNTASSAHIVLQFPVPMRASPSFTASGSYAILHNQTAITVTLTAQKMTTDFTRVDATGSGFTVNGAFSLRNANSTTAYLLLDAEL